MTIEIDTATELARYRFGPSVDGDGTVFRLWAPRVARAEVLVEGRTPMAMTRARDGFLTARVENCGEGAHYRFRIGDLVFPDLASRQQARDTNGWSIVRRPLLPSGRKTPLRPWHETLICEVHVGTVTPEGTFAGLRQRLEHFRDAGYTCIELMPVNECPGDRTWGYDGTLIFAPEHAYGSPEDLRALVDRAHELGLCMVLDVVYNHFGSFQNYVEDYAPDWFDPGVKTPWGPGVNYNEPMVRQFYYENAAMWLTEYDFDGLRFDAVHEIKTESRDRFLAGLANAGHAAKNGAKLIIENVENLASLLERDADNSPKRFCAQWNDDIHHVLNFVVTGEAKGGYEDPSRDAYADMEKALAEGVVHDGEAGEGDDGRNRGGPSSQLPPDAFISFVQNHDQIGNRPDSARLPDRIGADKLDFLHFLALLSPQLPLFFMGEEAHLDTTFPFFFDLPEHIAAKKRQDRYDQMKGIFNEHVEPGQLPDPNSVETFNSAKIPWDEFVLEHREAALRRFRELAGFRRDLLWPLAATPYLGSTTARQGNCMIVSWHFAIGTLTVAVNPTANTMDLACLITGAPVATGSWSQHDQVLRLGPWSAVAWRS